MTVHFQIGPELSQMTDEEVVELHNEGLRNIEALRHENDFPALEMPIGKPQLEWQDDGQQWTARGHVLRCLIHDDEENVPIVVIDDKELTWEQFGKIVVSYAGWGMRVLFVDDDSVHEGPRIEVREPNEDGH